MGCLFALFAGVFPRLAFCMVWIARPARVDAAFDSWVWPLLGVVFLPFTTLMYVILYQVGGLRGWDWFWICIAVLFDLANATGGLAGRRQMSRGSARG